MDTATSCARLAPRCVASSSSSTSVSRRGRVFDFEFVGRAHRDGTRARDASFETDTHLGEHIDRCRDVIERAVERGDFHAREETRDRLASRRAAERFSVQFE